MFGTTNCASLAKNVSRRTNMSFVRMGGRNGIVVLEICGIDRRF